MKARRLGAIMLKELRQLRRDRVTLAMIVMVPVMQLILFGYAINFNLRGLDAGIADQANTAASRALVMDMLATEVVKPVLTVQTPQQLMDALRGGRISVGISIPPDFEQRRATGRTVAQILVDGSDTSVLSAASQLAQVPVDSSAPDTRAPARSTPASGPISVVGFYNPQRRTAVNVVPGLIGIILTMTMVMFTAIAIVRERERGNMEFLIATPVRPVELVVGKVLPFVAIGLVQVSIVLALGTWIFSVPIRGSIVDVYLAALTYIVACLGLGVFISTLAKTQFQAMQVAFFTFLPQILLSGFMFPYAGMPRAAQWIAEVLPLTHFVRMIRGIMLRDATIGEMAPDLLALVAFSVIALGIATLRFRKRLD